MSTKRWTTKTDDPDWQPAAIAIQIAREYIGRAHYGDLSCWFQRGDLLVKPRPVSKEWAKARPGGRVFYLYHIPTLREFLESYRTLDERSKEAALLRAQRADSISDLLRDGWIPRPDAAKELGITHEMVRQWIRNGKLEQCRLHGRNWVRWAEQRPAPAKSGTPPRDYSDVLPAIVVFTGMGWTAREIGDMLGLKQAVVERLRWTHKIKKPYKSDL